MITCQNSALLLSTFSWHGHRHGNATRRIGRERFLRPHPKSCGLSGLTYFGRMIRRTVKYGTQTHSASPARKAVFFMGLAYHGCMLEEEGNGWDANVFHTTKGYVSSGLGLLLRRGHQ